MRFDLVRAITLLALLLGLCGCAANMAMLRYEEHAARYRDASVLQPGAARAEIVGRLGNPIASATRPDGSVIDLYWFDPNQPKEAPSRWAAVNHLLASTATLGLWEIVGVPIEQARKDRPLVHLLVYGAEGKLAEFSSTLEWEPAIVPSAERKKCELKALLAAARVMTPAGAENPIEQIKDSLRVNRQRDDAYQHTLLGCLLPHYVAWSLR